jgi:broad specificity polyphosphatase/5'/3'-nucleotidase SurE
MPAAMNDPRTVAADLYRNQAGKARMRRFWAFLTRTSGHLQQLCSGQEAGGKGEGAYVGMRTIAIETICGSEERAEDFDNSFRPLARHTRERWMSVAEARLRGVNMPPVQLIELGGRYYVRDGHHRISVAQALGESFVDAEVVRWQMR